MPNPQQPYNGKLYQTVMADPPWDIQQKGHRGAIMHYDLMKLDQIKKMPVGELTTENAHCWLWCTNATVYEAQDVLRAWGFTYRSMVTWFKFYLGLGNYIRNSTEQLLLGTKGRAPILCRNQPSVIFASRQDHSHKPEEQYAIIERCSPGPYLELFARRNQPGWDAWGNQILSDIEIPGYPVPRVRGKED